MKRNISVEMNTSGHLPDITFDYVQDTKLKKFYGRSYYLWMNIKIINRGV